MCVLLKCDQYTEIRWMMSSTALLLHERIMQLGELIKYYIGALLYYYDGVRFFYVFFSLKLGMEVLL